MMLLITRVFVIALPNASMSKPITQEEIDCYYDKVLSLLLLKFRDQLIFAGIAKDGKLTNSRRGRKEELALSITAQERLDIKIAVLFSVLKSFEELIGPIRVIKSEYTKYDLVVLAISVDKCLYILSLPSSSERIARFLTAVVL